MAGDSHEDPGGDTERDGKVVETHSRHASIGEESPSSSSSSSASSDAPARRFSLPAAMPAAPDSVAAPLPFEHSHRRLDTVVPVGMLAPQYHSGYRACPHRAHVLGGGPPCYLCSVLDAPPKYRKKEAKGWQKVKEKLALFSHGPPIPSQGGTPRDQEPPAAVFTISEWRPSNTTGVAPTEEVPASLSGSPDQRRAHERDNPAFDAQDSVEGGGECRATQVPSDSVAFGHSFAPHPPALITNTHLPPILLPQDNTEEERTTKCSRRMVCQLLYSFLLATASSTLIVNYEQPILVIISVIVFLALFVFLPIIAVLECLFRCKMERDFRQYINGIITSSTPPVTPTIF